MLQNLNRSVDFKLANVAGLVTEKGQSQVWGINAEHSVFTRSQCFNIFFKWKRKCPKDKESLQHRRSGCHSDSQWNSKKRNIVHLSQTDEIAQKSWTAGFTSCHNPVFGSEWNLIFYSASCTSTITDFFRQENRPTQSDEPADTMAKGQMFAPPAFRLKPCQISSVWFIAWIVTWT